MCSLFLLSFVVLVVVSVRCYLCLLFVFLLCLDPVIDPVVVIVPCSRQSSCSCSCYVFPVFVIVL